MSINYYAVATADRTRIGPLVEGNRQDDIPPLDVASLHRLLTLNTHLKGPPNSTLKWQDSEGGYVFVDLSPTVALVTQGTGGTDAVMDVMIDLVAVLNEAGLSIYDPQEGDWFPGSPVERK